MNSTIAEKDQRCAGRDLGDRVVDIGTMTTMHNHAGGDVALAEHRLNIADALFVFAEFIGIDFDTPAWQDKREPGLWILRNPWLAQYMWVPRSRGVDLSLGGLGISRRLLWYGPWDKASNDGIGYAEE